jgi:hypothetical protein
MVDKHIQGQPQCLRNVTTIGRPSSLGMRSLSVDGAWEPIVGAEATATLGGVRHEASSCAKLMVR